MIVAIENGDVHVNLVLDQYKEIVKVLGEFILLRDIAQEKLNEFETV